MNGGRQPTGTSEGTPPKGAGSELALKLRQAIILHRQGRFAEAERHYRDVLAHAPEQPDALHFLAVLEAQRGRHEPAIALMDRAIAADPRNPAALYNRANILRDMGRLEDALAGYDAALAAKPDNIAALNNRGVLLHGLGRYAEALANFDRALAMKADYSDAHLNRGNALDELGRSEEALASYDRVLAAAPKHASALYGKGNALAKLGRLEEAVAFYDRALALAPGNPQLLNNRGNALNELSRHEEALANFDQAIAAAPENAEAFNNRGNALMQLRAYEDALASYERALALNRAHVGALYGCGSALIELKRHDEAIAALGQLLQQRPDYPYALGMLVHARKTCCDWRDESATQAMIAAIRAGKRAATPLVLLASSDSAPDKLSCAQILMRDKFPPPAQPLRRGETYRHGRIRVAYLSADFRAHPVAMLMAGLFEHHDRERFETIAVSYGQDDRSEMRARLMRGFERFIDVRGKTDREVASLIREMEADIAVDLTGLTASGRPGILSYRAAPVQVNYLGFAGSLGAAHIDYILADRIVIPETQQPFYTEKVAYLPDSFMPHDSARAGAGRARSRAEMGLPDSGFVFASFNNSYKFAPATFDIWMRLLRSVDGSVLWLPAANPAAMRNLGREAHARGVAPDRIVFAAYQPLPEDHLARLGSADLFLDTLPYNAHTTASDALWAGLPVLTCPGESFASRVAASLLHAAGMPELIAASLCAYEAMALDLARDPARLASIKAKLRSQRASCALFDTARFTRHLEAAYVTMRDRSARGEAPASFAVEAAAHEAAP